MYPKGGIAFFDSGIGGLTTLSSCVDYAQAHNLGGINYYYYGDNFHAPYGNLSEGQIFSYVDEIFSRFKSLEVSAVVLACNTATAVCAERLREKYTFPIIGLEPAILPAAKEGGEVFVLATCATCNSRKFQALCQEAQKRYPNTKIRIFPSESLAGEIEKNLANPNADYSKYLPKGNPTRVVLGCTHYIYIRKEIERFFSCSTIDGNEAVARRLFSILFESEKWSSVVKKNEMEGEGKISEKNQIFENVNQENIPIEKKLTKNEFLKLKKSIFEDENREEKPLFFEILTPTSKLQPLVTPLKQMPLTQKTLTKSSKIFFLGDAKMVNKTKYEQMFAKK